MEERYITSVDLGTSKIAVAVARVEGDDVQMIYFKETPSEGVRNSHVFNPQKVSAPLRMALDEAERDLGIKVNQAVVGLPRYYVRQEMATARFQRTNADESISSEEINALKSDAIDSYPLEDNNKEVIFGAVAQSFSVEDCFQTAENDIVGMVSPELEGNFKAFIGSKRSSTNIDMVFNNIGVAIADKIFTPDAVARAVLTPEERENGVALIELGAGVTSVTIYKNDILRHYAAIPFGGNTITGDIKIECGISTALAENIKLAFGACQPDRLASMSEKIIQINYTENAMEKQLPVKYLSEIISCRESEIIDAMLYEIEQSGYSDELRSGVVITGGGANITNCGNLIKSMSGYNVREGYPLHLFTATGCSGMSETEASTSVGLIMAAKENTMLNCTKDAPRRLTAVEDITSEQEEEVTTAEEKVEQKVEQKNETQSDGTLFGDGHLDSKGTKTRGAKNGGDKGKKKGKFIFTWNKILDKVQGQMDSLYEGMEDE